MLVPPTDDESIIVESITRCDALVLLGGGDVSPARYGQEVRERLFGVDEFLDGFEITALRTALDIGMPVLAVCRGHQVLNVALGGTLVQHIDHADDHRDVMHTVSLEPGSLVAEAMGALEATVHSFHHQAIDSLGTGLRVTATADDGTIEAVELSGKSWVVGVQWHPEDTAESDAPNQALFDELVRRAARA